MDFSEEVGSRLRVLVQEVEKIGEIFVTLENKENGEEY